MNSLYNRPVGWRNESHRHYLAGKGIKTNIYAASKRSKMVDALILSNRADLQKTRDEYSQDPMFGYNLRVAGLPTGDESKYVFGPKRIPPWKTSSYTGPFSSFSPEMVEGWEALANRALLKKDAFKSDQEIAAELQDLFNEQDRAAISSLNEEYDKKGYRAFLKEQFGMTDEEIDASKPGDVISLRKYGHDR